MKKISSAKLSVVTITRNSERLLPRFLKSISFADEIVIVDGHSVDRTQKIAREFGANVYSRKFDGFGQQKLFGLQKSTADWILVLDVDEIVSDSLKKEIQKVLNAKTTHVGYRIPYQNHFFGRPLTTLEQYSKIRLFRRGKATIEKHTIHEETIIRGFIGLLNSKILHYSYRSLFQVLSKFTYYASLEAKQEVKRRKKIGIKHFTLYPAHMFWSIFVKEKGYKDGVGGFFLALCFSYYELMRYLLLLKRKIV